MDTLDRGQAGCCVTGAAQSDSVQVGGWVVLVVHARKRGGVVARRKARATLCQRALPETVDVR